MTNETEDAAEKAVEQMRTTLQDVEVHTELVEIGWLSTLAVVVAVAGAIALLAILTYRKRDRK